MTNHATIKVSSAAAAVDARVAAYPSTWQPCSTVLTANVAEKAIRVRMHDGSGFLTARRPKERSSP